MLTDRSGPAVALIAQLGVLAALETTVGLTVLGWAVGLTCGVLINAVVARCLARDGREGRVSASTESTILRPTRGVLRPGDLVTLTRATLTCAVAALVADSFVRHPAATAVVALAVAALVLDAVDGWVARRTGTTSTFGGRFDGEVDAFLIAVLSVYVARSFGWWVLAIGAIRYVFAVGGWPLPWLRAQLPFRYWRKVVTAAEGIILAVAAADLVPRALTYTALAVGLALLAESFGRDVWWLWRRRLPASTEAPVGDLDEADHGPAAAGPVEDRSPGRTRVRRRTVAASANVLAFLLVWFALVAPNQTYRLSPVAFLRIPVEGLVVAGLAVVLPTRARRAVALVVGVGLAVLTLLKFLDMGFFEAFDRPFSIANDRGYLGGAVSLLSDAVGRTGATLVVAAAALLVVALFVCMPLSVGRLTALLARHRAWSLRAITGLLVVWVASAAAGLQVAQGEPVASMSAGRLAVSHVEAIATDGHEKRQFDSAASQDPFRHEPNGELLDGLRGKDVLIVFVESYGRIALEGSPASSRIRAVLDEGTRRLRAEGFSSASAFLTSSTFGGLSWLAHGTLQSGLWVDNQRRYDQLLAGNRLTVSRAFRRAGWRTVALLPSGGKKWPEGKRFYQYDKIYGRWDLGYHGPRFGFAKMPDQFVLQALQRLELARPNRAPVMAEIELASSHQPWAKIPRMVGWNTLGDGSRFERMAREVAMPVSQLWDNPDDVRAAYGRSIVYSLRALISFVERYGNKNLVVVALGDHQPESIVSGHGASRDVPITIIAHDRRVIDRISGWGWQDGLRPAPRAPVWRMDAFRDRFFAAYSQRRPPVPTRPPPRRTQQ